MVSEQQKLVSPYSFSEELINVATHAVGFAIAIWGLVMMLLRAEGPLAVTSVAVYGSSLILMFLASSIYHAMPASRWKNWLKTVDHSAIYLLIAGTYTPFTILALDGALSLWTTVIIWSLALFGVTFKLFGAHRFPKVSVTTYLLMGWFALGFIYPLYKSLPAGGLWLLLAGGLLFSLGVAFYVQKRLRFTHAIWHLFVVAGCTCHFFSIYIYVL